MYIRFLVVGMMALLLPACASTSEIEAKQLAWKGPSAGPCLFGGVTSRSVQHCVQVSFGNEALLQSINAEVLQESGTRSRCTQHVAAVERRLKAYPGFKLQKIYSCPSGPDPTRPCHVSLMVSDIRNHRYVVDNGSVLRRDPGHVGTFRDFARAVDQRYWVGRPPSVAEAWGMDEIFANVRVTVARSAR
jgi:hypothetical protein